MEDGVNLAEIAAVVGAAPPPVVPLPDAAMDVEGGVQVSGTRLSPCQPPPTPPPSPSPGTACLPNDAYRGPHPLPDAAAGAHG